MVPWNHHIRSLIVCKQWSQPMHASKCNFNIKQIKSHSKMSLSIRNLLNRAKQIPVVFQIHILLSSQINICREIQHLTTIHLLYEIKWMTTWIPQVLNLNLRVLNKDKELIVQDMLRVRVNHQQELGNLENFLHQECLMQAKRNKESKSLKIWIKLINFLTNFKTIAINIPNQLLWNVSTF